RVCLSWPIRGRIVRQKRSHCVSRERRNEGPKAQRRIPRDGVSPAAHRVEADAEGLTTIVASTGARSRHHAPTFESLPRRNRQVALEGRARAVPRTSEG